MRILVLAINYWPEQTGIGPVLTRRCEYLASAGHEVAVCTSMPYYPEWRIPREYAGKLFSREERNGVEILRSWMWVPKKLLPQSESRSKLLSGDVLVQRACEIESRICC